MSSLILSQTDISLSLIYLPGPPVFVFKGKNVVVPFLLFTSLDDL